MPVVHSFNVPTLERLRCLSRMQLLFYLTVCDGCKVIMIVNDIWSREEALFKECMYPFVFSQS